MFSGYYKDISLTKRSLKGPYSISKGGALWLAPVGSPVAGPLVPPFKVAFSTYLQFPLVPPAKVPQRNYLLLNDITIVYICYKNVIYDIGTKILFLQ